MSPTLAECVLARKWLIDEDQIEIIPESLTASCLDESLCLSSSKKYFTGEAKNPRYFVEDAQIQLMMIQKIQFCVTVV